MGTSFRKKQELKKDKEDDLDKAFKKALAKYSKSRKFKRALAFNCILSPGAIVLVDKESALKLKTLLKDMYIRGRNDEKN